MIFTIISWISYILLWIFFVLGVISTVYEIYSNKKWFITRIEMLESGSISYHRINNLEYMNFIDLVFDIYYMIVKEKYVVFNFLPILILLLYPIVYFYLLNFLFWFLFFSMKILKAKIFNIDTEISLERRWCSPFDPLPKILKVYLLIIKEYSFYSIYGICFLFKKVKPKIKIDTFEKFVILFCSGFPVWYIQAVLDILFWLNDLFLDEIWWRKRKIIWHKIFIRKLKYKLFTLIQKQIFKTSFSLVSFKIVIKNREIFCNPKNIQNTLKFLIESNAFSKNEFLKFYSTVFYYKSHQFFLVDDKLQCGWHATSSSKIDVGSTEHSTFSLSHAYKNQKFMFSHVSKDLIKEGISKGIWDKYNLYNYENYAGMIIRLKIFTELHQTDTFVSQTGDGKGGIIKFDKKFPIKQLYFWTIHYLNINKNINTDYLQQLVKNNLSSEFNVVYNDINIKKEIDDLLDDQLYNSIKHDLYTCEDFQKFDIFLRTSHREIIETGKYV